MPFGHRYIAFGRAGVAEPGIYLATNRSGAWRIGAHPVAHGERCAAIVIDGGRHVHLLVVRAIRGHPSEHSELRYSTNRTGSWRASIVRVGEIGLASLALDRAGHPNVAGTDVDGAFLHERTASGAWASRYDVTGSTSHLRADPDGNLWVVMSDVGNLRFVRLTDRSGAWAASRVPVPFDQQAELDLAIGASGRRYVAMYDGATGRVTIRRDLGATWPVVDRANQPVKRHLLEMDIEPSGAIHLLFLRVEPNRAVVDLNRHGGAWTTAFIGYTTAFWSDLELDHRGRLSATVDRAGVVWSYWNPWTKPPNRFAISNL